VVCVYSPARAQCRNAPRLSWRHDKGVDDDGAGCPAAPGLILHTAHAVNGTIAMVEVWESAEDHHRFMSDPRMADDLAAHGIPIPDDLTGTPLILAYQP